MEQMDASIIDMLGIPDLFSGDFYLTVTAVRIAPGLLFIKTVILQAGIDAL